MCNCNGLPCRVGWRCCHDCHDWLAVPWDCSAPTTGWGSRCVWTLACHCHQRTWNPSDRCDPYPAEGPPSRRLLRRTCPSPAGESLGSCLRWAGTLGVLPCCLLRTRFERQGSGFLPGRRCWWAPETPALACFPAESRQVWRQLLLGWTGRWALFLRRPWEGRLFPAERRGVQSWGDSSLKSPRRSRSGPSLGWSLGSMLGSSMQLLFS